MTGKKKIQKHAGKAPPAAPESALQPDEAPAGAASEEEDEFAFLRPTETLRKQLLREELKLRKIQPEAWTRIKYRKSVKLPKDLFKKSRGQKGQKRLYTLAPEKRVKKRRRRRVFR